MFRPCGKNPVVDDPTVNLTYDALLALSDAEFVEYIRHMRRVLLKIWQEQGIPPAVGWTREDIQQDFLKFGAFPAATLWKSTSTGARAIHNTSVIGNSVNAWNLSRMLQTKISYTLKDDGRSIYDFFADEKLWNRYLPYGRRHFLRDSFYFFAQTVKAGDPLPHRPDIAPRTALEYVQKFAEYERVYGTYELLIEAKAATKGYSGYAEHLRSAAFFALSYAELCACERDGVLPSITTRILRAKERADHYVYHVRLYAKHQPLFPAMFKSFRVSVCQYAVQYPPLTAKLLYETFLRGLPGEVLYVWDPSGGWAGRCLGAMAADVRTSQNHRQQIRYLATDPNPDFYGKHTTVYNAIADFYHQTQQSMSLFDEQHHQCLALKTGSEVAQHHPAFQLLRGKLDMVFSSPPYFNRECYSQDEHQSYKKFGSSYESWRDGFLQETIKTAYEWLKPHRYFLWNIADIKIGKTYLPLQEDSVRIAQTCGFEYIETIAMTLRGMPGANRITEDGTLTARNSCIIDGRPYKYEPIFVFRKPQ